MKKILILTLLFSLTFSSCVFAKTDDYQEYLKSFSSLDRYELTQEQKDTIDTKKKEYYDEHTFKTLFTVNHNFNSSEIRALNNELEALAIRYESENYSKKITEQPKEQPTEQSKTFEPYTDKTYNLTLMSFTPTQSKITGIVKNNSDSKYSYIMVKFTLFDSDKNVVGYALDQITGLQKGYQWSFKALPTAEYSYAEFDSFQAY